MGFGWLFVGYFFAYVSSFSAELSFGMLVGFPLMIVAFYKLASYQTAFRACFYYSFASLPFALYFGVFGISKLFQLSVGGIFLESGVFLAVIQWLLFAFSVGMHLLLLYAVAQLTGELALFSMRVAAWRNLILMMLYYFVDAVARLPFVQPIAQYFVLPVILLRVVTILMNLLLIFDCYRKICSEEEKNKPVELPLEAETRKGKK